MENLVVTDSFAAQPSTPALTLINEELEEATAELDRFKEDKIGDEDLKRLQSEMEAADSAFRATKDAVWMSEKVRVNSRVRVQVKRGKINPYIVYFILQELEMLQSTDIAHSDGENCPTCGQTIDGDAEIQLAKTKKEIASKMEALEVSFTAAAEEVTKNSALLGEPRTRSDTLEPAHLTSSLLQNPYNNNTKPCQFPTTPRSPPPLKKSPHYAQKSPPQSSHPPPSKN